MGIACLGETNDEEKGTAKQINTMYNCLYSFDIGGFTLQLINRS